jgi:hypothetical protein
MGFLRTLKLHLCPACFDHSTILTSEQEINLANGLDCAGMAKAMLGVFLSWVSCHAEGSPRVIFCSGETHYDF